MIALECTCCGRPLFRKTDATIVGRLQASSEPLPVADLLQGLNVAPKSWHIIRHRLNEKLLARGLRVVNGNGPRTAPGRYRLERIEAAG